MGEEVTGLQSLEYGLYAHMSSMRANLVPFGQGPRRYFLSRTERN